MNNDSNSTSGSNRLINNIPKPVIDWLQQNVYKLYKVDPRTTFNDSLLALSLFKENLRPRTRVFTDSGGKSHLLLCLYGKFRIPPPANNNANINDDNSNNNINNNCHNICVGNGLNEIPVLVWIEENYPLTHPVCYLDLEQIGEDWIINMGKHIDSNGQIYLPFFKDWNDKDSNYNIINAVKNLQYTISNEVLLRRRQPLLPPKVRDIDTNAGTTTATATATAIVPPTIPERPKLPSTTREDSMLRTDIKQGESMLDLMDTDIISMDPLSPPSNVGGTTAHHQQQQQKIEELTDLLNKLDIVEEKKIKHVEDIKLNEIDESIRQFQETLNYENEQIDRIKSQIGVTQDLLINKIKKLDEIELNWSERYKKISDLLSNSNNDKEYKFQVTETLGLNQLYDLIAEDMALDDTISILNELLYKRHMTMDIFIRKTRDLAKRQFMIRLHIEKIYNMLKDSA